MTGSSLAHLAGEKHGQAIRGICYIDGRYEDVGVEIKNSIHASSKYVLFQ